jgi:multiple sugar transport system permease protein
MNRLRGRWDGLLFALPALLGLAVLFACPAVLVLQLGVSDAQGAYVGAANFRALAASRTTWIAALRTLYYVGGSIAGQVALGTAVGILLNQGFRGRGLVRSITLLPSVVPAIVAAAMWYWMLHAESGIVNQVLARTGVAEPIGWLTGRTTAMPAMIAISVWKLFPFVAIMVLAGLQSVPEELYEAARIDGASFLDEVRYVMLPQLRQVLVTVVLLLAIWQLNAVTLIYAITRGGPGDQTLTTPIQILRRGFEAFELNEAAALAAVYLGVSLAAIAIYTGWLASRDRGAAS